MDDAEFVVDEVLPRGERVGVEGGGDAFAHGGPQCFDRRMGRVGEVRVFEEVDVVDEPLAAFPEECGALPDAALSDQCDDAPLARGVVGGQQLCDGLGARCVAVTAGEVEVFVGRA